jgi:pyruvate/2-oxoglutarate dehydrogenase complex dihydrolipoamide acyltransferase (E2) component
MRDVHIPKMGMSTVEVDVLRVLVREGQHIEPGDVVVEIESEKANYEIEADVGGVVAEVLVSEGDVREVGDVVVRIDEDKA